MPDDSIDDFLAAVDELRGADTDVRTTAHTSSVTADGWPLDDRRHVVEEG